MRISSEVVRKFRQMALMVFISSCLLRKLCFMTIGPCILLWIPQLRSLDDLSFSNVVEAFKFIVATRGRGVPHRLNDQFRRRISLDRPFEGGFEVTSVISMAINNHVGYPLALDKAHAQTRQSIADYVA